MNGKKQLKFSLWMSWIVEWVVFNCPTVPTVTVQWGSKQHCIQNLTVNETGPHFELVVVYPFDSFYRGRKNIFSVVCLSVWTLQRSSSHSANVVGGSIRDSRIWSSISLSVLFLGLLYT